jgi:hypothetical protein
MAYIGRGTDKISNIEILDNITFDGSSSYSITKSLVAFVPNSAQSLLISIDGVVQAGNFTVSGSTIDFGTAVAGTSTCDFILHYGTGLITTPADGTVTTAKLADSSVSLAKLTATGTKDATTFLRGDNTFQTIGANTPAFSAYLSSNQSLPNNVDTKIIFDTENYDTDSCYDTATGKFTPTTAGKYFFYAKIYYSSAQNEGILDIYLRKNNNNFSGFRLRPSGTSGNAIQVSGFVTANGSSDYFEVFTYHAVGTSINAESTSAKTTFNGYKIIE